MRDYTTTLKNAFGFIENNLENDVSAQQVANATNYTLQQLNNLFNNYCSVSVGSYIRKRKLSKAAENLKETKNISNTAIKFGYCHESFTNSFKREFGISPREFLKSDHGVELYEPFNINKLDEYLEQFYTTLEKCKKIGGLDYKNRYNSEVKIFNINSEKMYAFLENYLRIPVRKDLLLEIRLTATSIEEYKELLYAVLTVSLIEYNNCNFDISKMSWSLTLSPEDVDQVDYTFELIEKYCDIENVTIDENDIVWFTTNQELMDRKKSGKGWTTLPALLTPPEFNEFSVNLHQ